MSDGRIHSRSAGAHGRHRDVAIRILSCDFPRGKRPTVVGVSLVVLMAGVLAHAAPPGGQIVARARVLASEAALEAERVAGRLQERPAGTPVDGDLGGMQAGAEVEIHRDGAWIRLSKAPQADFDSNHSISVVYLSN